jgi:APA family basic amino acid/polyamine antiporter
VWQAAGLMFFAFAGYARMATLGAEVKNPTIVLPRVIVATLVAVIVLYSFLGAALLAALGFEGIVRSATPVIDSVPEAWSPVIAGVAVLASLGSLMTILTGLSRTSYAMAGAGDMPAVLARIWSRTSSPVVADISTALVAMVLSLTLTPLWLVALSSASVLSYYALAHLAALRLHSSQRRIPQWVSWCGLVGCVLLVVALPLPSVATGVIVALVGAGIWLIVRKPVQKMG